MSNGNISTFLLYSGLLKRRSYSSNMIVFDHAFNSAQKSEFSV